MRLLFVTQSLVHGGAERHTITVANRLAERGHECHAAYIKNDPSQLGRYRGMASITCLDAQKFMDPAALRTLTALIRDVQPTHIVGVNAYALLYSWIAKRAAACDALLAMTYHTTQLRTAKEWLKMLLYRPFVWSSDWLVYVCEAQARYWQKRKLFARKSEVIYNGVDTEHFRVDDAAGARLRKILGFAETDLVVGMSAVLRPEKNHLQLVEAIGLLRRRGIPARALLIGDGEMRAAIEARAAALGLKEHVLITGLQQDVRPLVAACDAIALCSTSVETFSLAALEAMALARPVVHADIGGAAEMIRDGRDGFLFSVGDTRGLTEALAALADPQLRKRMGALARASVEERFSERAMIERYEIRLQELAIGRSKRGQLRKPAGAH